MIRCGKCTLPVYSAECVQAIGQNFHRHCFTCSNGDCGRGLDSRNCCDHESKPYCSHCHRTLFGPKGVGYGVGAGILSSGHNNNDYKVCYGQDKCNPVTSSICYGVVRAKPSAQKSSDGTISAKPVLITSIEQPTIVQQFYSPAAAINNAKPAVSVTYQETKPEVTKVRPFCFQQKSLPCARCSKLVYEAEKIIAAGRVWHRGSCFSCAECSKRLESRTMCEREGQLFCNNCYARNFGPKGYGHGIGAGILQLHQ